MKAVDDAIRANRGKVDDRTPIVGRGERKGKRRGGKEGKDRGKKILSY